MRYITDVSYIKDYKLRVFFGDKTSKVVDLQPYLDGPVFEPLKNTQAFARFKVDAELETIAWENGADLAPEYIYYQTFKNEAVLQMQFMEWGYVK